MPTSFSAAALSATQIALGWSASTDNVAVTGYRVTRDGVTIATTTSTSYNDSGLQPDTTYVYTVTAVDAAGNFSAAPPPQSATTLHLDTASPSVAVAAPAAGSTVSSTIDVTASASDDTAVVGVQFKLNGAALGAEDTSAPYQVAWNTTAVGNGTHLLTAVARDAAGHQTTSDPVTVTVANADPGTRRIQSKSGSGAPAAAVTLSFDAATTTGNTLIVAVSDYYANADPDTTISDSKNNTWRVAVNYTNAARVKVYYAENITGGSNHQIRCEPRAVPPSSSQRPSSTRASSASPASTAWRRTAAPALPIAAVRSPPRRRRICCSACITCTA